MFKRFFLGCLSVLVFSWSLAAFSAEVGLVDMQEIFKTSARVQKINTDLNNELSPKRDKLQKLSASLDADVKKLQRDEPIMKKNELVKLRAKVVKQDQDLRAEQAKYQQAVFQAQNTKMGVFMSELTSVVKKIAKEKKLDYVFPKNSVLYTKDSLDITPDVLDALNK